MVFFLFDLFMISVMYDRVDVFFFVELEGCSNMFRFSNVNGVYNIVV